MFNFSITLILFSLLEVSSKNLMNYIDAITLTFLRFALGFVTLVFYAYYKNILNEIKKIKYYDLKLLAALGVLNITFAMSLLQLAVKYSHAATAAVIFCSNPFFVFLFSILSKSEKFDIRRFIGVITGIGGVAFVMARHGLHISPGAVFAVLSSMMFAFYIILNKKAAAGHKPVIVNIISFLAGLIVMTVYLLISGRGLTPPPHFYNNTSNIMVLIFLGVAVSGVGYITFIETIKKYSPVSASVIFLLKPALATIFAVLFIGERLDILFYIGLFLVMSGSWLILSSQYYKTV